MSFFSLGYIGSLEMWRMFLLTMHVPWCWVPILTRTIRNPEASEPETLSDILTYTWILFWLGKVCVPIVVPTLWPYCTIGFSCEQCQHKKCHQNNSKYNPTRMPPKTLRSELTMNSSQRSNLRFHDSLNDTIGGLIAVSNFAPWLYSNYLFKHQIAIQTTHNPPT